MERNEKGGVRPIRLVATNVISKKGYYPCEVTRYGHKKCGDKPLMVVNFRVFEGKYKGFDQLSAGFYYETMGGKLRLTYLCEAVGITGQLSDPRELLGKRLKLRVVPKLKKQNGRLYRNYIITRFHSLKKRP